jgi:hypothetical protein
MSKEQPKDEPRELPEALLDRIAGGGDVPLPKDPPRG